MAAAVCDEEMMEGDEEEEGGARYASRAGAQELLLPLAAALCCHWRWTVPAMPPLQLSSKRGTSPRSAREPNKYTPGASSPPRHGTAAAHNATSSSTPRHVPSFSSFCRFRGSLTSPIARLHL